MSLRAIKATSLIVFQCKVRPTLNTLLAWDSTDMAKKWNHTTSFAEFGTKPRNVNWSWSARNEATGAVVVTLWMDHIVKKNGETVYKVERLSDDVRSRSGFKEMMENFAWATEHSAGKVHVILAVAKDTEAEPRSIERCYPVKWTMTVQSFNADTGAFFLVQN